MKFRSIRLSGQEVQQVLLGKKTQVRELVRPQPDDDGLHDHSRYPMSIESTQRGWWATTETTGEMREFVCPYGNPGDGLWVRETWTMEQFPVAPDGDRDELVYRFRAGEQPNQITRWRPATQMPEEACRLFLEVVACWPERLHSISYHDIARQGLGIDGAGMKEYQEWWEKKRGKAFWRSNPWMWACAFKVIDKPENF